MKIALVHTRFGDFGGAERYALGLGLGLGRRGHEVHLYGREVRGAAPGVRFHRVPAPPFGRAVKTFAFWALTRGLGAEGGFDVIQGFGKTTCQNVHRLGGGLHRAYLDGTKSPRRSAYDRVVLRIEDELFSSGRLDAVVCPSRWVAREVERWYPAAMARVRVLPNGVDTQAFRPEGRERDRRAWGQILGIPRNAAVLLFAATNFHLKGLDLALAALPRLPTAHLLVVGGDRPAVFERTARELGVAGRVHFLGARSRLDDLYRAADALLHPTRYDPFANVCLEALACGTPVVTTDRNGVADLLSGGRTGRVVPWEQGAEGLAAAVGAVLAGGGEARGECVALAGRHDLACHLDAMEAVCESARLGSGARGHGGATA